MGGDEDKNDKKWRPVDKQKEGKTSITSIDEKKKR